MSLKKTAIIYQTIPVKLYNMLKISVEGKPLETVENCLYIGCTINNLNTLGIKVNLYLKKGKEIKSFDIQVWFQQSISFKTKLVAYNARNVGSSHIK